MPTAADGHSGFSAKGNRMREQEAGASLWWNRTKSRGGVFSPLFSSPLDNTFAWPPTPVDKVIPIGQIREASTELSRY